MNDNTKLTLRNVSVIFANLKDDGFGKSITINADNKDVKEAIEKWVKDNNIGKGTNAGKANFKEYEGRFQYSFKLNDYTKFAGLNGLTQQDLGFGAKISLIANAFEYDNKFGKGVGSSLSAVVVEKGPDTSADRDLEDLLGDSQSIDKMGEPISLDDIPI